MDSLKILYVILIVVIILIIIGVMIWVSSAKNENCNSACLSTPNFVNGPGCLSLLEDVYDESIPKPTPKIYLGTFTFAAGAGNPFLLPVKYALRYVTNSGNKYGPLSKWSDPIFVGSTTLPCLPSTASQCLCSSSLCNLPQIVTNTPYDVKVSSSLSDYSVNVHRIVGSLDSQGNPVFSPNAKDEIVGMTYPLTVLNGNKITSAFTDAQMNPN